VSTVRTYGTVAGEFVAFIGTRGGVARCDAAAIDAFVATLTGYQVKTVEQKLCALRSFLRFASAEGPLDAAVVDVVPAVRSSKQAGVPSVWEPGEVARILEAIDRGNPCGKRDYAIVLLIARLGLRSIDVKRLEFGDLDWPGNRLFVTQAKTGGRVQLPLLKDVGWAVIDYMRSGRPACDCPQVFVRHTAPIGPFSDQDHLHQILVKHARVAHVAISEKRRHGMHSLRHTLATRLLEGGTPLEQIADILGHQSVRSTGVYLKSSLGLLAKCALDPDAPAQGVSE
jgi:integrase